LPDLSKKAHEIQLKLHWGEPEISELQDAAAWIKDCLLPTRVEVKGLEDIKASMHYYRTTQ
jgi:hypothetical protein